MYFQIPKTEQKLLAVAKQYHALWNFSSSFGVIDGKSGATVTKK